MQLSIIIQNKNQNRKTGNPNQNKQARSIITQRSRLPKIQTDRGWREVQAKINKNISIRKKRKEIQQ